MLLMSYSALMNGSVNVYESTPNSQSSITATNTDPDVA